MLQHKYLRKEIVKVVDVALLKKEIDELGVTQLALAKACKVSRQTIANWLENPELISAYHARLLADALRITDPNKILAIFFASNVEKSST